MERAALRLAERLSRELPHENVDVHRKILRRNFEGVPMCWSLSKVATFCGGQPV